MSDLNTSAPRYRRLLTRKLPAIAAALIAALLIAVWVRLAAQPAQQPEKLVIAISWHPAFALIHIADERGYFKDENLQVELRSYELGRDALNSVIEGKADLATVFETPVVQRIYQGTALGIISTLHTSSRSQVLIARRDRGITDLADIKGKRIGVTPGSSMEYFIHVLLTSEGIATSSVTVVPVEPINYVAAIASGEVDAVVVFGPYLQAAQEKIGKDKLSVFYSSLFLETSMLAGMRDNVLARKQAMTRLLKAILRAQEFTKTDPEESLRILVRRLADRHTEAGVRQSWENYNLDVDLDNLLLTLLTQEARWFRDKGLFNSAVPDFTDFIVTDYLHSLKPGAVTLHKHSRRQ